MLDVRIVIGIRGIHPIVDLIDGHGSGVDAHHAVALSMRYHGVRHARCHIDLARLEQYVGPFEVVRPVRLVQQPGDAAAGLVGGPQLALADERHLDEIDASLGLVHRHLGLLGEAQLEAGEELPDLFAGAGIDGVEIGGVGVLHVEHGAVLGHDRLRRVGLWLAELPQLGAGVRIVGGQQVQRGRVGGGGE